MEVVVKDGQTLADIAVQEFGAWEAVTDIADLNGISISDVPEPGVKLRLPDKVYSRAMQSHCKANGVSPATVRDTSAVRLRIFTQQFTKEFK